MNFLENCLLLAGLPFGLLLAGYWLAARLSDSAPSERLAVSALAGLGVLLWSVATINLFKPISGLWAWLCLWPIALTLLTPRARNGFGRDLLTVSLNWRGAFAAITVAVFVVLLLWPLFSRPTLVYYDGTSNHDAFFWIAAAEHLKRHTYLEVPPINLLHPLSNATPAFTGWRPPWGRMGAEGLLAFTSSIIGLAPVKLYLAATATLIVPWIAAVFLAVRTFYVSRLGLLATFALVALQPVFVFYHGNANLPNFVGALAAAGAVLATERALRSSPTRFAWLVLLALSVHGVLCSYPEMLPFVIMPAGLLWLRVWFKFKPVGAWRPALLTAAAWIAGFAINLASTIRGARGFVASFETARANQNWANLFDSLSPVEYPPGLATLSVVGARSLGPVIGALLTIALLIAVIVAFRRASDRIGALFTFAGSIALLVYTLYTGFNYGWQKTVQFGGAFWAALFPVVAIEALTAEAAANIRWRPILRAALWGLFAFFGYATVMNCLDGHKWARRKILTQDWFTLRDYARSELHDQPVLVDGATFRMSFFHGMWATYFLPESAVYFAARGHENGGYLREVVKNESQGPLPPISAYLVSREWADTFDANSPRLVLGDSVALLKKANRVLMMTGLGPENGPPESIESQAAIELRPHSNSTLQLSVDSRDAATAKTTWQVKVSVDGAVVSENDVSGPAPWQIEAPLTAGKLNRVELHATLGPTDSSASFAVRTVKITSGH